MRFGFRISVEVFRFKGLHRGGVEDFGGFGSGFWSIWDHSIDLGADGSAVDKLMTFLQVFGRACTRNLKL